MKQNYSDRKILENTLLRLNGFLEDDQINQRKFDHTIKRLKTV